jgi:hypothetical protein
LLAKAELLTLEERTGKGMVASLAISAYLSGVLAATLFWAAWEKLRDPFQAGQQLAAHLPVNFTPRNVRILSGAEMSSSLLLILSALQQNWVVAVVLAIPAFALFGSFSVFLTRSYLKGVKTGCGCFGSSGDSFTARHVARAYLLFVAVLFAVVDFATASATTLVNSIPWRQAGVTLGLFSVGIVTLERWVSVRSRDPKYGIPLIRRS